MMMMKMHKKLVIGLALALVLVSGAFVNANAQCATCLPNLGVSSCMGSCNVVAPPPLNASCQGAYHYGPTAPVPMGSVGGASGG